MVALKGIKPQKRLWQKDECLLGAYVQEEIMFSMPNLHGLSYRLCIGATITVTINALVNAGTTFDSFRLSFCEILLPFFVHLGTATPLWEGVMLFIVFGYR